MNTEAIRKAGSVPITFFRRQSAILLVFSLGLALLFWHLIAQAQAVPIYLLPAPGAVWGRLLKTLADGSLLHNAAATLSEVLSGLALGFTAATFLGYLLARSRKLERLLAPYIVASQAIPIVAIAPLLVIWFGPGLLSKTLVCALIVFFPILINTVVGIRSVPDDLRDLMRSLQATRWQTFTLLEVPAALPVFLGGLRIGATLAVIGAVVGELVNASQGLGFLINQGVFNYDKSLVFVGVFTLVGMAMFLYGAVSLLEYRLLKWQRRPEAEK
jgi:NitT/TauT family transport system permease protein